MLMPLANLGDIALKLCFQSVGGAEGDLVPHPSEETQRHRPAIDILIEVEQVGFDGQLFLAEGGFHADGNRGGCGGASFDVSETGVNAVCGDDLIRDIVKVQIDSGEVEGATALFALDDGSDKLEGTSQSETGIEDTPLFHEPADERGTDRDDGSVGEADRDLWLGDGFESHLSTELLQHGHVAFALTSEVKVLAFDDRDGMIVFKQDVQKRLGWQVENVAGGFERFDSVRAGIPQKMQAFMEA